MAGERQRRRPSVFLDRVETRRHHAVAFEQANRWPVRPSPHSGPRRRSTACHVRGISRPAPRTAFRRPGERCPSSGSARRAGGQRARPASRSRVEVEPPLPVVDAAVVDEARAVAVGRRQHQGVAEQGRSPCGSRNRSPTPPRRSRRATSGSPPRSRAAMVTSSAWRSAAVVGSSSPVETSSTRRAAPLATAGDQRAARSTHGQRIADGRIEMIESSPDPVDARPRRSRDGCGPG